MPMTGLTHRLAFMLRKTSSIWSNTSCEACSDLTTAFAFP